MGLATELNSDGENLNNGKCHGDLKHLVSSSIPETEVLAGRCKGRNTLQFLHKY